MAVGLRRRSSATATEAERAMVFDEVLSHTLSLTTDVFGNYVVQKLLEHGTDEMRRQLVQQMTGHVLPLSLSTYGCRVVQRALDVIDQASRLQMADELREQVLQCVRDQNANHVVQKVLERVSPTSKVDYIPQTFRGNVFNLAAHCYSCRVLQRIFEHCDVDQTRPLMDELLANTERLMHDQYGNYVVQWVLRNAEQADKDSVIVLAKGNVLRLSCHKFASNVVEQIIAAASGNVVDELIEEIVSTPTSVGDAKDGVADEANVTATVMMRDQYGNYVLQRFLERADARQKQRLVAVIRPMLHSVKRSAVGYTKHLAAIERLLDSSNVVQRNNAVTLTGRGGGGAKNQ